MCVLHADSLGMTENGKLGKLATGNGATLNCKLYYCFWPASDTHTHTHGSTCSARPRVCAFEMLDSNSRSSTILKFARPGAHVGFVWVVAGAVEGVCLTRLSSLSI